MDEKNKLLTSLVKENSFLKERNKLYEEILDKVLEGVYITDLEENCVWFNNTIQLIDGVNRNDAIGKKQSDAWDFFEIPENAPKGTIRSGKQSEERLITYLDRNKKPVHMFSKAYPFYHNDSFKYVYELLYYVDYSEKQLNKIAEYRQKLLKSTTRIMNNTTYTLYDLVGSSSMMKNLVAKARRIAVNKTSVLIYGKTGTGKELFAQGIHNASLQKSGKFVALNCAAIPENLLESILFGSVKGAFTGATDSKGLLEEANNGTLFFDELNSMPLSLQGKLLRVIQERQACRVGSNTPYPVNCRWLSATNKDPEQLVADGFLRADLYFRLAVLMLEIPPLKEREQDVLELSEHFIDKYNKEYQLQVTAMDEEVKNLFLHYSWPGNVRELDNTIEYVMNFLGNNRSVIHIEDLPDHIKKENARIKKKSSPVSFGNLQNYLEQQEKEYLTKALAEMDWNISKTAKVLGIPRESLYYRLKKYGLKRNTATE